jgi:hypothetical protein
MACLPTSFVQDDLPDKGPFTILPSASTQRRRPLSEFEVAQRILLSKGSVVYPRSVVLAINGRMKTFQILRIMQDLAQKGAGFIQSEGNSKKYHFIKGKVDDIVEVLKEYSVDLDLYARRYCNT